MTNVVTSLIYIGCTINKLEKRIKEHFRTIDKQDDFHKAIKEFGKDSFTVEILEYKEDGIREDGLEREKYWIEYYNSTDPSVGYNRTRGGLGTIGYVFTEDVRRKISVSLMGRPVSEKTLEAMRNMWKGKHLPLETRQKISQARMGKYKGKDNPFYGKHHSDETKRKIGELNSKPVIGCSNTTKEDTYFNSLADAARYIQSIRGGVKSTIVSHIGNSIKEINCKTAYGYKWRYAERSNDYPDRE